MEAPTTIAVDCPNCGQPIAVPIGVTSMTHFHRHELIVTFKPACIDHICEEEA